jgi:ATP phosphoribosyltransferase regulatory subunit
MELAREVSLDDPWLLPEGIEEVLPPQAEHLETIRRDILDLLTSWGYELVIPPLIEYLESLLTGLGGDLDLQTFKITDQLTGRLMGVRADMTPQVARIDANRLMREVPTRLCYLGPVLRTLPDGLGGTRNPFQVGAELYGHDGLESDLEILLLMLKTLKTAGLGNLYVDLGHIGIFRGLVDDARLTPAREGQLFDCLQRKARPEIDGLMRDWGLDATMARRFKELVDLNGDISILAEADRIFQDGPETVRKALAELSRISAYLCEHMPEVGLHIDLAELAGYHYHTGVMFAAYLPGQGQALARGGRYDGIGRVFGRARPATGFSIDLKLLAASSIPPAGQNDLIFSPWPADAALASRIESLRQAGKRVVHALPGQAGGPVEMGCNKQLVQQENQWIIVDV